MSWALLVALAALTIASRVLPLALLPTPRGRVAAVLEALPAPLFASLAILSLLGDGARPSAPALAATAGAALGAARRSLLLALVCGIGGFLLTGWLTAS